MLEENIPNVCRACLSETGDFQSIYVSDEAAGLSISEMIMEFASVQVTFGDGLPETICSTCARDAVKFYLFKLKCEATDKVLRNQLGKSPPQEQHTAAEKSHNESKEDLDVFNIVIKPEMNSEDSLPTQDHYMSDDYDSFHVQEKCDSDIDLDGTELVTDDGQTAFQCAHCPKIFTRQTTMNRHIKTHSAVKAFQCTICNKSFSRNDLLLRHKIAHAIKMAEQSFEFENDDSSEDVDQEDGKDTLVINTETACNLLVVKEEEVHLGHGKESGDMICQVCAKQFSKPAHLNRHMKIHAQNKPYMCPTCSKAFVRSEQLANHMNIHSGIKPHVCAICLKGFNQISNLKDHMRTHNGEKPFLCSTCGKGFNQLGNLRQHTIRHSGIKAHLCSICGNGFASKGELSAHLRKHTGARPFVCQICSHGFTTSSSLTKHKRIHSGEKPYECDVCHMKFSRSGILARHKRTHTGEKPYICKFCTKAFSQSNDLTSHLRIHTGEKPYICDVCGQAFRQSSALKTHKKTHVDKNSIIDSKPVLSVMHTPFIM